MKHFLSAKDMTRAEVLELFELTRQIKEDEVILEKRLFAANLFFEPSTRTKMSFMMAEKKLGIETLDFATESSSMKKGESLYDTVKTFEAIGADMFVIRHEADDWPEELIDQVNVPIFNAGAGKKEHPTQSLLDAYTIYEEYGSFENLNIVICGDILFSRVARSNAELLKKLGAKIFLMAPDDFKDDALDYPYISMDEATKIADVLMLLRIQLERHHASESLLNHYHSLYGLTKTRERNMKKEAIILHPAPVNRGVEIDTSLVECNRSRIFKQMTNGVYVREAIILTTLLKWGIIHENQIKKYNNFNGSRAQTIRCAN